MSHRQHCDNAVCESTTTDLKNRGWPRIMYHGTPQHFCSWKCATTFCTTQWTEEKRRDDLFIAWQKADALKVLERETA